MNYLKEITGKKDTSEFDVVSFPLVQKKKYFGTLEKTYLPSHPHARSQESKIFGRVFLPLNASGRIFRL